MVGLPLFDYLAQHPEEASHFSEAMVGYHGAEPPAVAAAYDFGRLRHHRGRRRRHRATCWPPSSLVMPRLAACCSTGRTSSPRLPALLQAHGVADRVTIEGGSFFERVPAGGDAYVLSHIIHDWNEDQCLTILGHCRKAMEPDGRLLIVETVLPPGDTPHQGKVQDMVMLVVPGGQERTEAEYADLLGKAGFRLSRVVPTDSIVSIVEAVIA